MNNNIIIIGSGQQANVVRYNIEEQGIYKLVGYLDPDKQKWNTLIDGIKIFPDYKDFDEELLVKINKNFHVNKFFIGIGNMILRRNLFDFFVKCGWNPVNIIHPNAVVSKKTKLGRGVLIECGCLITPNPIIGNNVVINTGSQVNHDNVIEDDAYIASGVVLSGGVVIKKNTLIDDNVTVTLGKTVGENCIIGAGSVVTKDIPDNVIAYGNPCKVIRTND